MAIIYTLKNAVFNGDVSTRMINEFDKLPELTAILLHVCLPLYYDATRMKEYPFKNQMSGFLSIVSQLYAMVQS